MRLFTAVACLATFLLLSGCATQSTNRLDPYEGLNRKTYQFNKALDTVLLKPSAQIYKAIIPGPIRQGVSNAFNNTLMIPTVANDLLQGELRFAIKDSWRFIINSTFGLAGLFDVAASSFSLPPHYNDLGLTFAKWGDQQSPYLVLPLFGPSTIRDAASLPFNYLLTPYAYLDSDAVLYSLMGLRYLDLRSQLLESEPLLNEALDQYSFIRDAYLQRRHFLINGEKSTENTLYIDNEDLRDYVDAEDEIAASPLKKASPAQEKLKKSR